MKNIHILPTEKLSRLVKIYNDANKENFTLKLDIKVNDYFKEYLNICITNDEEIKDGNWCLDKLNQRWKLENKSLIFFDSQGIKRFSTDNILGHECKKIILTTDQDLIEDGVQPIDDDFLEWFIKNKSCVKVDIESRELIASHRDYYYKIIISKEKTKQETLEEVTEIWLDKYSERFDITKSRHLPFSFSNRNELEKLINEVLTWQKEISKENMWESYKAANTIFIDKIALRKEFELWFENFNKK